jgi:hypothetical protein
LGAKGAKRTPRHIEKFVLSSAGVKNKLSPASTAREPLITNAVGCPKVVVVVVVVRVVVQGVVLFVVLFVSSQSLTASVWDSLREISTPSLDS